MLFALASSSGGGDWSLDQSRLLPAPIHQPGRSSSLATGETTVDTCFRYTGIKWEKNIDSVFFCLRMARLMPLLLAAASANDLKIQVGSFSPPNLLAPSLLDLRSQTSPTQPQNRPYPYFPAFNFLSYQPSQFTPRWPYFFSPSLQVE